MKLKNCYIPVALLTVVCIIWAILSTPILMADEKVPRGIETKTKVIDKGENPADGEPEQLRERIKSLEATIARLERKRSRGKLWTGWGSMPGLRGSLVDLPCVQINIDDLPLDAIRHGLTKKNILKAVETQFQKHNIKTLTFEHDDGSKMSHEEAMMGLKIMDRPQLHIRVLFWPEGEKHRSFVEVSMEQDWEWGYSPLDDTKPSDEYLEKIKKNGLRAIEETLKSIFCTTTWKRKYMLMGKIDNFAEDEANSLEELVGLFINDYLLVNPKGIVFNIFYSKDNPSAVIRGQTVHEGDKIDDITIVKIHKDKVEFEKNGKRWTQEPSEFPSPEWQ